MAQHFAKQDTDSLHLFERSLCEILGFISDFAIQLFLMEKREVKIKKRKTSC